VFEKLSGEFAAAHQPDVFAGLFAVPHRRSCVP
jgi:hypothetical protein